MTFGRELVVLLTEPSMFGKFLVHAWRSCGDLNNEHSISVHEGSNSVWHAKRCLKLTHAPESYQTWKVL
jgi:hypothetical protein